VVFAMLNFSTKKRDAETSLKVIDLTY